jgi:proton-dependent oligopeptide transporter, POT family
MTAIPADTAHERHPKGLYVLFATEMWERFGFYAMLAMLTLYMRDSVDGFGWTTEKATSVYSWYQALVYATPLIGGWLADRYLGYRNAITIGAVFLGAGYFLLAVPKQVPVFYLALVILVIGNGFFKPNVSSIVGNLYREGSHLKDRAYLVFYMGINIGAFISPLAAEFFHARYGFNPAFAVSGVGMVLCLMIFWGFRSATRYADRPRLQDTVPASPNAVADTANIPPAKTTEKSELERVPEWKRIGALIVIFALVIVFWMVFQQNGSTLTFWANDNTAWNVSGIISNAINPFWIITLSLPLAWFWGWLDRRGLEPSTPAKITLGMVFTGISLLVLYFAALSGGYTLPSTRVEHPAPAANQYWVKIPEDLRPKFGVTTPPTTIEVTRTSGNETAQTKVQVWLATSEQPLKELDLAGLESDGSGHLRLTPLRRVSPWWLIIAYLLISLGELMLSPMGLALVSKVAPPRMRGLMMGGWFLATAIGNKLTAIGVFWDVWSHAKFFLTLSLMAFGMAVVLFVLIIPLKKAMPGV